MTPPTITFVNHASIIFSHRNVNLITDPWLFGSVFNNGWKLVSKTKMQIQDFEKITHIWFSHEHPDHFNIPVLKSIPEEIRKKITVLFHETLDHRIANKCNEFGFNVIEMKPSQFYELSDEFKIKCTSHGLIDSWFYAEINNTKILNLNDCRVNDIKKGNKIHSLTGNVDVLLTQYSYAGWIGNPEDVELRKSDAKEILHRIKMQIEVFHPKFTIPFASFIRFSHIDNSYMNDEVNRIEFVEKFIKSKTDSIPIILYPGDEWKIFEQIDNTNALKFYKQDFEKEHSLFNESPIIPLDELKKLSMDHLKKIRESNNWTCIRFLHSISIFKKAKIFLKDLDIPVSFDLVNGIQKSNFSKKNADIITDSDSMAFIFSWDYGLDTLGVNARYRTSGGNRKNFFRFFTINIFNNNGITFPLGVLRFLIKNKNQ